MKTLPGLRALVPDVDDLLVDLWGVIHDGERPYEGVIDALKRIAALPGRRVLFLSNTSRLKAPTAAALVSMGIGRQLFVDVVTSGDVTRDALISRDPAIFAGLPTSARAFHQGDSAYARWLFEPDIPLQWTDRLGEADLVVASGASASRIELDEVLAKLAPAAARGVPLVCTNPDRIIPRPRGAEGIGPGAIAHGYAALGGEVFLYGKPHAPIYAAARQRLGEGARRVVAIGDLVETDIRGAADADIPSVLVARGREEHVWSAPDLAPDFVVDRFSW